MSRREELSGAEAVEDLFSRARSAPVPVILLTDEELAGLHRGAARMPAPLPWLGRQEEPERRLACKVAMRGLVARGLVVPLPGSRRNDAEGAPVAIHQDLRATLTMRQTATAVVVAERQTSGRHHAFVLYLGWGGVLAEDISPDGMHGFTAMTVDAAGEALAAFAAPLDEPIATPGPLAAARTVTLNEIARGTVPDLDRARSVTLVGRLCRSRTDEVDEERLTVYDLGDHAVLAEPAGDEAREPGLTLTPARAAQLRERLTRLIEPSSRVPPADAGLCRT